LLISLNSVTIIMNFGLELRCFCSNKNYTPGVLPLYYFKSILSVIILHDKPVISGHIRTSLTTYNNINLTYTGGL